MWWTPWLWSLRTAEYYDGLVAAARLPQRRAHGMGITAAGRGFGRRGLIARGAGSVRRTMRILRLLLALGALAAPIGLWACGDDESSGSWGSSTPAATEAASACTKDQLKTY